MIQKRIKHIQLPTIGQGMGVYKWDGSQAVIIRQGIELGMNLIDSAENYDGSEDVIGRAIKGIREKVLLATKFSPEHSSYAQVIQSAENSLRRLQTEYIDLYQSHWPNPDVPIEETLSAMRQLVKEGKVRFIGLCNVYDVRQLENIDTLQVEYNLLDRTIEGDVLPTCKRNGIMVIAYTPLSRGSFTNGQCGKLLNELALKYNKTPAQVALRWVTDRQNVVAIPKTSSMAHLIQNANAIFDMDSSDVEALNSLRQKTKRISPKSIRVGSTKKVYVTIEEARENKLGFVPSPESLANDVRKTRFIKPIKVTQRNGEYILEEGSVRYWAWVLAFNDEPVPTLIGE